MKGMLLALLAITVLVLLIVRGRSEGSPSLAPSTARSNDATERTPEPRAVPVPTPPATVDDTVGARREPPPASERARWLSMPDGTWLPALNGVLGAPAPNWNPERPYAAVIARRAMVGVEWYVHEDGSVTTTRTVFRRDVGQDVATTETHHPVSREGRPMIVTPDGRELDPSLPVSTGRFEGPATDGRR